MKLNLKQLDLLYSGHVELLEHSLNPRLIYKLVTNRKVMQTHIENMQETIAKVEKDNEGKDRNEIVNLQNEAIQSLFRDEVEVDLKMIEWSELPQEIKGTTINNIAPVMTGEL